MAKRLKYLDMYKGMAMLLVLTYHVFQYFTPLKPVADYICNFHVAMFYVAAGYLPGLRESKKIDVKEFITKKITRLLIPYICFALLSAGLKIGVSFIANRLTADMVFSEFLEIITIGNGPVWFLYRMFIVEIIFLLFNNCVLVKKKLTGGGLICLLMLGGFFALQPFDALPILVLRSSLMGFLTLMAGWALPKLIFKLEDRVSAAVSFAIVLGCSAISVIFDTQTSYKTGSGADLLSLIVSVLLACGYLGLFRMIPEDKCSNNFARGVEFFGRSSLTILGVHPILLNLFSYPFENKLDLLPIPWQCATAFIVLAALICALFPCVHILEKYFPFVCGISGKRGKRTV